MINDIQLNAIEGCVRMALQKITDVRNADRTLRAVAENPTSSSSTYRHEAERAGRHADMCVNTALEDLRDELNNLLPNPAALATKEA
jgi:hypothetical protein